MSVATRAATFGHTSRGTAAARAGIVALAVAQGAAWAQGPLCAGISEVDEPGLHLGWEVQPAGDVDGDGYEDVLTNGVHQDLDGVWGVGATVLFRGSADGLSTTHSWRQEGTGFSPAMPAGDVDGDGFDDVLLMRESRVEVYRGARGGLPAIPDQLLVAPDGTGAAVTAAAAGDVDGDGFDDVLLSGGALDSLYLYTGSASGLASVPDWSSAQTSTGGIRFGRAGDVNGDGFADALVTEYEAYSYGFTPLVRVFYGGPSGLGTGATWSVQLPYMTHGMDLVVASVGDANGDGFDDIVIGAEPTPLLALGSASGLQPVEDPLPVISGRAVAAGDLDGDGLADIALGGALFGFEERVEVLHGSPAGWRPESDCVSESAGADGYGQALAVADVDGDGIDELLVGAPHHAHGERSEGVVFALDCAEGIVSPCGPGYTSGETGETGDTGQPSAARGAPEPRSCGCATTRSAWGWLFVASLAAVGTRERGCRSWGEARWR